MRNFNNSEIKLINSDLEPLERFFIINDLYTEKVKNKYVGIEFHAESKQELGGANGIARINSQSGKRSIGILDTAMQDDKLRSNVCYHELGHALMGMTSYEREDLEEKVLKHIVAIKNKYPDELSESIYTYLSGFSCLEEWLVEKFAQMSQNMCKKIPVPSKKKYSCPDICGDYKYWSSMNTKYGIFEGMCDTLVAKSFGDLATAIRSGLSEDFFGSFFEKFEEKEIMTILGNFGKVYQAIMNYSGHSRNQYGQYSPESIKKVLVDTEQLVQRIHHITPELNTHRR